MGDVCVSGFCIGIVVWGYCNQLIVYRISRIKVHVSLRDGDFDVSFAEQSIYAVDVNQRLFD